MGLTLNLLSKTATKRELRYRPIWWWAGLSRAVGAHQVYVPVPVPLGDESYCGVRRVAGIGTIVGVGVVMAVGVGTGPGVNVG